MFGGAAKDSVLSVSTHRSRLRSDLKPGVHQFAKNNRIQDAQFLSRYANTCAADTARFTIHAIFLTLRATQVNTDLFIYFIWRVCLFISRLSSACHLSRSDSSSLDFLSCAFHSLSPIVYYVGESAEVTSSTSSARDPSDIPREHTAHSRHGNFSSPSSSVSLDSWLDGGVFNWGRLSSRYS